MSEGVSERVKKGEEEEAEKKKKAKQRDRSVREEQGGKGGKNEESEHEQAQKGVHTQVSWLCHRTLREEYKKFLRWSN